MKTTNYIITHKAFNAPKLSGYVPLQVGFGEDLGGLRDNTADNIAEKNASWCELTGLYWIWKNDKDSDVLGLCHYRRYFEGKNGILTVEEEAELLKHHDLLIAEFEPYKETVYEQYCNESGFAKDLDTLREILCVQHPEDVWAFDEVMAQGGISQYNMMAAPRALFMEYCAWLFPLLEALEAQVDLSGYNDYQKRIYGFLSERLLNVWVKARKLNAARVPVLQVEMTGKEKARRALRRARNRVEFRLKH